MNLPYTLNTVGRIKKMRIKSITVIFALLLFTLMTGCSTGNANTATTPGSDAISETDAVTDKPENIGTPNAAPETSEASLVWRLPPTLEHDRILLCACGSFHDPDWTIIDPATGLLTYDSFHGGHGGPGPAFVYDRERNLFGHPGYDFGYHDVIGMHPLDEFAEIANNTWLSQITDGLLAVENVDSSLRRYIERDYLTYDDPNFPDDLWWLTDEAYSGQFAVMYNRKLITDFIFDGGSEWWRRFPFANDGSTRGRDFIAMSKDGAWGLIDTNGNAVLSFLFENLLLIDENTAFARYNGKYGILEVRQTIANWE